MSKSVERQTRLQMGILDVDENELEWTEKLDSPYTFHAMLLYKPINMEIEQASEHSMAEAKAHCIKELAWRMKHWDEWQKSCVRESD